MTDLQPRAAVPTGTDLFWIFLVGFACHRRVGLKRAQQACSTRQRIDDLRAFV